jgi:hypothetical protein
MASRSRKPPSLVELAVVAALAVGLVPLTAGQVPAAAASSSPDVSGQKYSDASSALSSAGFEPVVSTAVGDRNAWPDCVVTFIRQRNVSPPPNSRGAVRHQVLVSLNCNAAVASATAPGYSAGSPEGKEMAKAAAGGS